MSKIEISLIQYKIHYRNLVETETLYLKNTNSDKYRILSMYLSY